MAAPNFTPIQLYSSGTASAAPSVGNLTNGELALNYNNGKLYYKNSSSVVTLLASAAGALGNVVGPASATTDGNLAAFDGVTGKLIKQAAAVTVAQGGTGQTTFTDGQLLIGNTTGNTLTKTTLTAGANITITNGSGAITIAATGSGGVTSVTGTSPIVSSGGATPAISLTTVPVNLGGTNLTSYTSGGVLFASGTGTLANGSGLTFSSGNLGLGVASPFYKFDVETTSGGVTPYIASFTNTSTSSAQANLIRITQLESAAAEGILGTAGSSFVTTSFRNRFLIGTTGNNNFLLITNSVPRIDIDTSGNAQMRTGAVMPYAPTPASISTTATLANADIQAQIINTTGTSYTVTMPLGSTLESLAIWAETNISYDFTVINTASGTITVAANTGVTTVGGLTLATGTSGQFRIRRIASSTFILYRLS